VSQDVNGSHDEPSALAYVHVIAMVELRRLELLTPACKRGPLLRPTSANDERPGQKLLFNPVGSGSGRVTRVVISQIPPS